MNKTTNTMSMNRQKKKRQPIVAFAAAILLALFTQNLHAQNNNVYMHSGTQTVPAQNSLNFYDSGGASSPSYWWEKWYNHNENATLTFKNGTLPIQVTFNQFTAYDGNTGANIGQYALRINDDHIYVYEGDAANDANLITVLTGTIKESFTFMSNGPITFKFVSNGSYREEGWEASVSTATAYKVQQPIVVKDECSDEVVLYNTAFGASLYYTTNGSDPVVDDPLTGATLYDESFIIDLDANNASVIVKAIAVVDGQDDSDVATHNFKHSDQRPIPTDPTITINGNTVTITPGAVPEGLNETYNVRYTVDGTDPSANNGTLLTSPWAPFEWHTPSTTFKAVTVAVSCSDKVSNVVEAEFGDVTVPTPVITFNANGSASISCSLTGATIYYTLDGSEPTTSSTQHGITSVTTEVLAIGTTVKAIANYDSEGYVVSGVASSIYVPEGGSTVGGGIVLLDDREPHTWSYYSDGDQPIHSLKPADVKITYFGNGTNNMTTAAQNGDNPTAFGANATGVQVNVGETENQFIYLKTLENDDPEGEGNEYSYTLIPNPFQVRPKFGGGITERTFIVTLSNRDNANNWSGYGNTPATVTVRFNDGTSQTLNGPTGSTPTTYSFTKNIGTIVTVTFNHGNQSYPTWCQTAIAYQDGEVILNATNGADSDPQLAQFTVSAPSGGSDNNYRGFYAWRVKSLSSGLAIQRANGTNVGLNGIINAEEDIKFVTSSEDGNEVEFEALWAQAYVTNSTSTSGLNANVSYERNFMVLGSNPSTNTNTVTIGSGNTTNNGQNLPLYISVNGYPYSVTQFFYTPSEIGMAGSITQLAFYVNTGQNSNRNIRIYLNHTSSTSFEYDNGNYYTQPLDESYLVYSGNQNFNAAGWKTITLDTPFAYDGTSYLCVAVIDMTGQRMRTPPTFRTYNAQNRGIYGAYNQAPDLNTYNLYGGTRVSYIPQMRFTITTSPLDNLSVPLTITTYNPNGTGGASSVSISNSLSCGADLKFENIKMNAQQINAAGHDLVFGRGVTPATSGGTCVGYVFGTFGPAASSVMNNTLRLESGSFTNVYGAYHSSINITSSDNAMKVTFGNDYDRANASNTALTIAEFMLTYGINFSDNHLDKVHVKSGTFNNRFYNGYYYTHSEARGSRNVIVDGGLFNCDFAGGINGGSATVEHIDIRVHGGEFKGAIYCSGEYAAATGDRRLVVTGGDIEGWIAGGCNGLTSSSETTGGALNGDTYLYIGGNSVVNSNGNNTVIGYSTSLGGNIYGAGSGKPVALTMGQVNNSNVVIADNATIERNVFGGGNYGYVGSGESNVFVLGGTVSGSVFGGSNLRNGHIVNVTMKDGSVAGSLYGGSNEEGVISDLATVSMEGGTVTNVYGGGYGASTNMAAGTSINISDDATINNNVYGGGELGTVTGTTNVTISGGTMKDVYGAGKGGTSNAVITGQTHVTVTGGTIANVYGGGEDGDVVNSGGFAPDESTTYNFDNSSLSGWTNIDADGDGYVWVLGSAVGGVYLVAGGSLAGTGHNASADLVSSGSYSNVVGALTPDNYFVSPQTALGGSISFWACAQDATYSAEVFGVAVSTTSNTNAAAFTTIQQWTMTAKGVGAKMSPNQTRDGNRAAGTWRQYTVDLSAYAGQTGYVAIRHFGCTDQFMLNVDDITITEHGEALPADGAASIVTINGATINGDVFGGGKMGKTTGAVTVNMFNGNIRGNVFGGAYGEQGSVYVTGLRTVNMTGGHVYGNIYGGSRYANDGNDLNIAASSFGSSTETATISVTNISGGTIDQNVYSAGYYGNTFGSVYTFIGKNAIENAPNKQPTSGVTYGVKTLIISETVWAGGDWGTFSGSFGGATISGNSNIYVDGTDYETTTTQTSNAQYMNIGGSVLGCGTSCDAGKAERTIMIRNYGTANTSGSKDEPYSDATRTFFSIQRAKLLVFDNAHLNFSGQGMVNSLGTTEKYSIYEIANTGADTFNTEDMNYGVRLVNGSSIFLNAPVSQISNFISASCNNIYTANLSSGYTPLEPSDLSSTDNKVRVNGGTYVEVKYGIKFGMLKGYAHMMVSAAETDATCAYARPRWETNAAFNMDDASYDNRNDGGWVSYTASNNTFDLAGNSGTVQMPYENHTHASKNGEDYFRIWRAGGIEHYREGVFDAHATGTDAFKTVDVTITLPPLRDRSYVYRFETVGTGENTSISYGADIMAFDAARATGSGDDWISFTTTQTSGQSQSDVQSLLNEGILANPDVNYGLVIMPTANAGLAGGSYLISQNSDENLALTSTQFTNNDFTKDDQVTFRLTYYDKLSANMTWDPMTIVLVQVDPDDPSVILDRVTISLAVNTSTTITQEFNTTLYAVMQGKGSTSDTYTAKVMLPTFTAVSGQEATFTVNSVSFEAHNTPDGNGVLVNHGSTYTKTQFAVSYGASVNYDNTDGWANKTGQDHDANQTSGDPLGQTGGRSEFAIDFTLHFNGHESITTTDTLGLLTFNITFDNFVNENNQTVMDQPLTIKVYVIRRGQGARFYLDGINGSNLFDGRHPDQAALSLSTIFNRLGYLAGDEIYIVNQVTADKSTTWNGSAYDNVHIYRYNGGHDLATADGIVGNAENTAYKGVLVNVTHGMVMTGITLDGYYNDGVTGTDDNKGPHTVTATAPMITVANGAVLELNEDVLLTQNNNNTSDGGAVNVASGGTLKMNADATITKNLTAGNGGGVYMDGVLNVSDNVKIFDNKKGSAQNNVYLTADRVVTIGTGSTTDTYGALSADAKIGVTKTTTGEYTEVVHVDSESDVDWLNVPYTSNPNAVIYHDANIYQLERYNDITYLYWVGTWVTTVTWNPYFESRDADGYTNNMTAAQLKDIKTPQQLAWVISMVNGVNNCTPQGNLSIEITADIDMDASIWVPIGTTAHPFAGSFEGNGHVIEGLHSTLVHNEMGVFGNTSGTIQNAIFVVNFDANATNLGSVAGNMTGGTVSNVEAAGTLTGGSLTENMGGLVGVTSTGAEVQSSFAVNSMTSAASTVMGGLVGTNGGDIYNSYSNTAMSVSENIGGLAGDNTGHIENCYSVVGVKDFPSFAYNNSGTITYCYADKAGNYVSQGQTEPTLSGNYSPVKNRNEVGYMYGDNKVTASGNTYVKTTHTYPDKHTVLWDGLLSVLNQWVTDHPAYTKWYRPITQDINGDLPVLAFSKAISMATVGDNKKFLDYSIDLDELLESYSGQTANIFLYDNATGVDQVPGANVNVFINEDAVLLQSGTDPFINTTVGVTFENSCKNAQDFWGNTLTYDWHLLSTPLSNAPLGITYTDYDEHSYWGSSEGDTGQVDEVSGGYMPDGIQAVDTLSWDFYTYYEPQYHWINFKRNINSHHHYEEPHEQITYTGMEQTAERVQGNLIRGRGYMMAINQDSYLNTTGTLNNGVVSIPLTKSGTEEEDATPQTSKDWGSNLVGNPYHAYLNLDAVTAHADNGGVNSFYIYDADNGTYGPYMTGSSINPAIPSKFIHPHQGFFVVTSEEVSDFKFTYDMATDTPNTTSYYRGEEQPAYPVVNLFVANENGNRDMAVIELDRPEIGGARKINNLRNTNFKISAYLEGQDYGLLFTPEGTQRVPVHFQTAADGTYTITWSMYNGDFSNLFLVDNKTGVRTDMLRNDSYTFNASTDDYASRFYLTYRVTGVDDYTIGDGEEFAFFDGSEWIINGQGYLQVIDMTGRVLHAQQLSGNQSRVHINNVAAGVYVLQLNNGTKNMTQKIVIR